MTTLTVTSKGQVTLRKEVLKHLGVKPGDKIDIDLLPNGTAVARSAAPKRTGSIEDFFGMLGPWDGPPVSIEEMNEIIAKGWAGELEDNT